MRLLKPVERGLSPGRRIGRRVQQGFTLIELMIVVAIIGILASIAIPQYQRYTGKAQLTEALNIASGRKAGIGELLQNGVPLDAIDGATNGVPADVTANAGKYVVSLSVLDGTIVAVMNSTTVSPCVVGAVLTLEPVITANPLQPIQWLCKSDAVCKPNTCI